MNDLRSVLVGTAGLAVVAAVALGLALTRSLDGRRTDVGALVRLAALAVAVQAVHFGEELTQGFAARFPALLGLPPWPGVFFVGFNVAWFALWILAILALPSGARPALFALWFLALAALLNGLVHPLLAVVDGAYFPGLWSAPVLGVVGALLLRRLLLATRRTGGPRPP